MSTSSFWRRLLRRDQNQTELLTQLLDEQRRTAAALEQLAAQVQKLSHTQSIRQTSTQMRLPKIASEQDLAKVPALTQFLAERGIAIKTLRTRRSCAVTREQVLLNQPTPRQHQAHDATGPHVQYQH
jgi:glycine cleavage system regulatory protein